MSEEPREISKLRIGQAVRNIKDTIARLAISTLANALDAIASRLLAAENKLSGIDAGAQVNVIESVKVNGTALPVQSKAVDVPVPNQPATSTDPGLMSAADKAKLDGIAAGATHVDVDSALSSQSTNPVQNKVINTALDGKSNTGHTHDDRYYTESETDTLLNGKSDTNHNHDDRYYTGAETDALLNGKSDIGHNHDDRYYTESETDTLLNGKSDTTHNHDDRYYTEAETDALLNGKSDTGHTHDDRYYTETETDAALAEKVAKSGDTMTGDLTIEAFINAALGDVPTAVCDLDGDLNNATETGFYYYTLSDAHIPQANANGKLIVIKTSDNYVYQFALPNASLNDFKIWARSYVTGSWGAWVRISSAQSYPYIRNTVLNSTATSSAANTWVNTGLTVNLTAGHLYAFEFNYASGLLLGIQLRRNNNAYTDYEYIAETGGMTTHISPIFYCATSTTYQVWVKRAAAGTNGYKIIDLGVTT